MSVLPLFRAYLFDLDGTIYLGDSAIPGVPEAISRLRARGAKIMFLTNKPLFPPQEYAQKLRRLGIEATPEDVLTSSQVLADHVREHYRGARVYLIGEATVTADLSAAGALVVADWREADLFVASWDRTLTYAKLDAGLQALLRGLPYLATNPDAVCPVGPRQFVPDCGALLAALEAMTGRRPDYIAGKPSPQILLAALRRLDVPPCEAAFIGDRLYTDIVCAHRAGVTAIAVLTGEASPEAIAASTGEASPDYVLTSAAELA